MDLLNDERLKYLLNEQIIPEPPNLRIFGPTQDMLFSEEAYQMCFDFGTVDHLLENAGG